MFFSFFVESSDGCRHEVNCMLIRHHFTTEKCVWPSSLRYYNVFFAKHGVEWVPEGPDRFKWLSEFIWFVFHQHQNSWHKWKILRWYLREKRKREVNIHRTESKIFLWASNKFCQGRRKTFLQQKTLTADLNWHTLECIIYMVEFLIDV